MTTGTIHIEKKQKLVGFKNFVRNNPRTDRFTFKKFHHLEFYCQDATNTSKRFSWGLGLKLVAKSDLSTGNHTYASFVGRSGEIEMIFTAPYGKNTPKPDHKPPNPSFDTQYAHKFTEIHGLAVRALGVAVEDAKSAYEISIQNGAIGVNGPNELVDTKSGKVMVISEVKLYGDVVLRYVSGNYDGCGFPGYEVMEGPEVSIGLERLDHAVGNVPNLMDAVNYIMNFCGFHEFAEFTAEDVGTIDSGLNSMVLASNNENILLPINEPTFGTKRKSQIQTYLEQNEGPGLQHLALKTNNIFHTLSEMRQRSFLGGFEFMPKPTDDYYEKLPGRIGSDLTKDQFEIIKDLGILVDKDDQGILLQIFTKPLGDRPTIFIEIIERIGCMDEINGKIEQAAGCGGFGKGNFSELFKSIEEFEKSFDMNP